jgi:hypothetical protein
MDEIERESYNDLMSDDEGRWKEHWSPQQKNKFAIKMSDFEVLYICLFFTFLNYH